MQKCHICNNEIVKNSTSHIYKCAKEYKIIKDRKFIKFDYIQYNTNTKITEELIIDLYTNEEYSLIEIAELFNISYRASVFILEFYKINKRKIKDANSTKRCRDSVKKTCLEKYGVDNPSKSDLIKTKKENTFMEHYGVTNIFAAEGVRDMIHQIMMDKFGRGSVTNINGYDHSTWWSSLDNAEKMFRVKKMTTGWKNYWENLSYTEQNTIIQKRHDTLVSNPNNILSFGTSSIETRIKHILQNDNIKFKWQKWIDRKSFDFHIIDTNIILEVNGDYWHANPIKYSENDLINYPNNVKTYANDIWIRDIKKKELAEKYGYNVYYIWEHDMMNVTDNFLSKYISDIIKNNEINDENQIPKNLPFLL